VHLRIPLSTWARNRKPRNASVSMLHNRNRMRRSNATDSYILKHMLRLETHTGIKMSLSWKHRALALSQISFALTGLAVHANHLFYRFRTVFRVLYAIRPWYESCVRLVSPSDLVLLTSSRPVCARSVVFELYSESFRHRFVIICVFSVRKNYGKSTKNRTKNYIRFFQSFQSN